MKISEIIGSLCLSRPYRVPIILNNSFLKFFFCECFWKAGLQKSNFGTYFLKIFRIRGLFLYRWASVGLRMLKGLFLRVLRRLGPYPYHEVKMEWKLEVSLKLKVYTLYFHFLFDLWLNNIDFIRFTVIGNIF